MPAYFYHLVLEVLCSSHPPKTAAAASSPALDSAWEALIPFQTRVRSSISASTPTSSGADSLAQSTQARTHTAGQEITLERRFNNAHASSSSGSSPGYSAQHSPSSLPANNYPSTSPKRPSDFQNDTRAGAILIEYVDMVPPADVSRKRTQKRGDNADPAGNEDNLVAAGIGTDMIGPSTKGRYVPLDQDNGDGLWGIIHLYRDVQESPYLAGNDDDYPAYLTGSAAARHPSEQQSGGASRAQSHSHGKGSVNSEAYPFPATVSSSGKEGDCTTLCILAVPSYWTPPQFLAFMGQETIDAVSHFRMIRTPHASRYMVLMKFRSAGKAKEWQKEWDGKVFNNIVPETCHVVFVKSVEIQVVEPDQPSTFPFADLGPLSPSHKHPSSAGQAKLSAKPPAPPTPALIELPTCPVCLERMDETSGLLTIACQHVFHCTCLQNWKGSGCPVCRFTLDDSRKGTASTDGDEEPPECSVCHADVNLWACLICGSVGCGRYDGAHAFDHWQQTGHAFAIDLNSQRVWDYVGDSYVHRIILNKTDGKLVELPAADNSALDPPDWADAVPREKLENLSLEYTHLLTSQLESQRAYFEEIVERAADKASRAVAAAESAEQAASEAIARLADMQAKYETLTTETIPSMEREQGRLEKRAEKFEALARRMEKDYREEKTINTSLMERLEHVTAENATLKGTIDTLKAEIVDLQEQNRDLTFFISGSQKLQGAGEDIEQGTVSVPDPPAEAAKKKRNRGKGRK